MQPLNPVFIVGCPRSGNTLLGCLLNKHPESFILFEKKLFSGLRRKWRAKQFEDASAKIQCFLQEANAFIRQKEIDLGVSFEEFEAQHEGSPAKFGGLLDSYMQILIRRFKPSATIWGDKSPQHTAYLAPIHRTYPQARFLFIYRDPRHVVNSLSKKSFPHASNDPLICAEVARRYFRTYEEQKSKVPHGCILEVQYEELVRNPESELLRICEFLGIEYTERLLEPADEQTRQLFGWPNSKAWGRVVPQSSSTRPDGAGHVEAYLAEWVETFGYSHQGREDDLVKKLFSQVYLAPFKASTLLLGVFYKLKYKKDDKYLPQEWPKISKVKKWILRGEKTNA